MKHFAPRVAVDLLSQAIERIKTDLKSEKLLKRRARIFWAGVLASRNLGATDIVENEFVRLAIEAGLIWDQISPSRKAFLSWAMVWHLIRWGLLARDPFGERAR